MKKTKFRKIKLVVPLHTAGFESRVRGNFPGPEICGSDRGTTEKGSAAAHMAKGNGSSESLPEAQEVGQKREG